MDADHPANGVPIPCRSTPEGELLEQIKAIIAALPTCDYRRVHAFLRRRAEEAGEPPPNHKRVWRVMKAMGCCWPALTEVPL